MADQRMRNHIPWNIIVKTLKGEASPEEQAILENWLKEDEEHFKIFAEVQDVDALTSSLPTPFYPDKEKAWRKIDRRTRGSGQKRRQMVNRLKYSAAAV